MSFLVGEFGVISRKKSVTSIELNLWEAFKPVVLVDLNYFLKTKHSENQIYYTAQTATNKNAIVNIKDSSSSSWRKN